jgi:hypothetical protein
MIIGITGALLSPSGKLVGMKGTGKDTCADFICSKSSFVKVSLADPLKRICQDVFAFSDEQLWGPSELRDKPDMRYVRINKEECELLFNDKIDAWHSGENTDDTPLHACLGLSKEEYADFVENCCVHLTPRFALQQLGTEWGRHCYQNVWVDHVLRTHERLQAGGCYYDQRSGLRLWSHVCAADDFMAAPKINVIVPDVRFIGEIKAIKEAGGTIVRVVRPILKEPESLDLHPSEQEALAVPDEEFDVVLPNNGDKTLLEMRTEQMLSYILGRIMPYDDEQKDVPPFLRKKK